MMSVHLLINFSIVSSNSDDVRPKEWHVDKDETPILPLPPPGELQQDYTG